MSFAKDGLYVIDRGAAEAPSAGRAIAVGPMGRIWISGGTIEPGVALFVRLDSDGKADPAFGTGGHIAITPQPAGTSAPRYAGIAALPGDAGGALLVSTGAGEPCVLGPYCAITGGAGSTLTVTIVSVNAAGVSDATFAAFGAARFAADKVLDVVPDGAGGAIVMSSGRRVLLEPPVQRVPTLLRFDAAGMGSNAFMINAAAGTPCVGLPVDGTAEGRVLGLADGRFQVVQTFYPSVGQVDSCGARLDAEGRADPASWWTSATGYFTPALAPRNVRLLAVLAGPDGSLELVHRLTDPAPAPAEKGFAIVAIGPAGSLDLTRFPAGASVVVDNGPIALPTAVTRSSDGRYLVAGYPAAGTASGIRIESPRIARYLRDGTLDLSFGGGTGYASLRFEALGTRLAPYALRATEGALLVTGSSVPDDPREPIRLAVTRIRLD